MSVPEIRNVIILGAGRLAASLSQAMQKKGYTIRQVYNRSEKRGKELSVKLGAEYISEPEKLSQDADLYIVAVSDDALPFILERFSCGDKLIVHTSGTAELDILLSSSENTGVIYPPQTFTSRRIRSFRSVPLCIEANSPRSLEILHAVAGSLSDKIYPMNSAQRRIVHLAAVFANNFTNFMYCISQDLLLEKDLPFGILEPIIRQTAKNVSSGDIFRLQTGPAVREDFGTIATHQKLLSSHPEYRELYNLITNIIIQQKKKHDKL